MKALTVCQPWAWMIVHGPKRYENREWQTSYRGLLLIHAGRSRSWIDEHELRQWRAQGLPVPDSANLPFGAIMGVCRLVDCLPIDQIDDEWASGPWCWQLDDVRAFDKPIPYRGGRGLFDVPDDWAGAQQLV
ncbi:MAG: ASCH domain-containing protein [Planctomycetota bacterium]|jgi:hypothetical protein